MLQNRSKKVLFNITSGLVCQLVIIALGFLVPRLYLVSFGSEVNGVLSTIKQIFAYLCLLEAGVGLATTQALYAPLANGDRPAVSAILSATKRYYLRTGAVYGALVVLIALVYSYIAAPALPPPVVFTIVLLNGVPSVLSYLLQGKYRLLLEADGRAYVINTSDTVVQLAVNLGKIGVLVLTDNLILVQLIYCVCAVVQMLCLCLYARHCYPWLDWRAAPDFAAIAQKNAVILHQISAAVFNNTDIILLSFLCDFKIVSVYTIYNLFFTQVQNLITAVTSGVTFLLGQLFYVDRRKFIQSYDIYETLYIMGVFMVYTIMALFLLPVIQLYTRGVRDINYIDLPLLLLFVGMNLLANGKLPSHQVINISGGFRNTRHQAVIEAALNIVISVAAICAWGIYGAIVGTIAALLYRGVVVIHYANRKVLCRSPWFTYRRWLVNMGVFLLCLKFAGCSSFLELSPLLLLGRLVLTGLWVAALYLTANIAAEHKVFRSVIQLTKGYRNNRRRG